MPQDAVYVLNHQFIFDAIFPRPEHLGMRTKKQEEFLSPLTLMTHSQKFYSHCYKFEFYWLRSLISQGKNMSTWGHSDSFNWKSKLPISRFLLLQHELT